MKKDRSPGKSPGFWFYPADFERDMQMLSLAAQGLWIRMLGWMHENEAHRGFLELPTGEPMSIGDISARAGKLHREVDGCLREMERIGVYSRDDRGCLYCRRMARDSHISTVRKQAATARLLAAQRAADGKFAGNFAPANTPAKVQQNPTVTVSVSDSVSDSSETPPSPSVAFDYETGFGEVWQAYPQKGRTKIRDSERQYVEAVSPDPHRIHALILQGIQGKWAMSDSWARGFVCSLSEFLRNCRWLEDPEPFRPEKQAKNGRVTAIEASRKSLEECDLSDVETAY